MPRINPQNNNSNLNESPEASANVRKLERIKDSWHHESPHRLFDMCIDVLAKNIDLLLVKKKRMRKIKDSGGGGKTTAGGSRDGKMVPLAVSTYSPPPPPSNYLDNSLVQAYNKKKTQNGGNRSAKSSVGVNSSRIKYDLAENVGPLPATICEAIITRYSQFYLSELGKLERDDYFQIMNAKTKSVNKVIESLDKEFLANPSTQPPSKLSAAEPPVVRTSRSNTATKPPSRKRLVTHFDLIMTFASRADKCSLNSLQYRQCMWAHSTLEQRLKARRTLNHQRQPIDFLDAGGAESTSNYFTSFSSSSSSSSSESDSESEESEEEAGGRASEMASDGDNVSNYYDCVDASSTANMAMDQQNNTSLERHTSGHGHGHQNPPFKGSKMANKKKKKDNKNQDEEQLKKRTVKNKPWTSLRSRQPEHLVDSDLRVALKSGHHIECLDICPCQLTNESIALINRHLASKLKYLRFQNCCNWQLSQAQQPPQQPPQPPQPQAQAPNLNGIGGVNNSVRFQYSSEESSGESSGSEGSDPDDDFLDCHGNVAFFDDDEDEDEDEDDRVEPPQQQIRYDGTYLTLRNEFDALMNQDERDEGNDNTRDGAYSDDDDEDSFDSNLKSFHEYFHHENDARHQQQDEEEDEEDDDGSDTYAFDAYLQEYLSRYDNDSNKEAATTSAEGKSQAMVTYHKDRSATHHHRHHRHCHKHRRDERMDEDEPGRRHHHHHSHRHHHHHHHRHDNKRKTRRNREMVDLNDYFEQEMDNRTGRNAQCLLFKASVRRQQQQHHSKSSKQRSSKSRASGAAGKNRCSKHQHSGGGQHSRKKAQAQTSSNTTMSNKSSTAMDVVVVDSTATTQRAGAGAGGQEDQENNSILKWFKYAAAAASSKAALGLAATTSGGAGGPVQSQLNTSAAAAAAATASSPPTVDKQAKAKSLIEQLKQKASLLTETKMIDKVSMTSSTNENEAGSGGGGGGGVETASITSNGEEGDCYSNNQFSTDGGLDADSMDFYYPKERHVSKTTNRASVSSSGTSASAYGGGDEEKKLMLKARSSMLNTNANTNNEQAYRRRRLMHLNEENSIDSLSLTSSSCSSSLCAAHIGLVTAATDDAENNSATANKSNDDDDDDENENDGDSFTSCCSTCCSTCDDDQDAETDQENGSRGAACCSSGGSFDSVSSSSSASSSGGSTANDGHRKGKRASHHRGTVKHKSSSRKRHGHSHGLSREDQLTIQPRSSMLHHHRHFNSAENEAAAAALDFNLGLQLLAGQQHGPPPSQNAGANKRIRQQRLLEKVANLGSSPINVIQAIAAKALHFKLKNAVSFAEVAARAAEAEAAAGAGAGAGSSQASAASSRPMTSRAAAVLYSDNSNNNRVSSPYGNQSNNTLAANRLLRQYKFLKSTNMNKKTSHQRHGTAVETSETGGQDHVDSRRRSSEQQVVVPKETASSASAVEQVAEPASLIQPLDDDDNVIPPLEDTCTAVAETSEQQPLYEFKMPMSSEQAPSASASAQITVDVNVPPTGSSSSSSSSSSDVYKKSTKRLKESDDANQPPDQPGEETTGAATTDVEMKEEASEPAGAASNSVETVDVNQQAGNSSNNIPSNLFSVLKLWMSKRVDLLNSSSSSNNNNNTVNNKSQQRAENTGGGATADNNNLQLRAISSITGDSSTRANENNNDSSMVDSLACQHNQHRQGGAAVVDEDYDLIQLSKLKRQLRKFKKLARMSQQQKEKDLEKQQNKMALVNKRSLHQHQQHVGRSKKSGLISAKDNYKNGGTGFKYNRRVQVINLSMLQHLSLRNLGSDVIDRKMLNNLLKNFRCLKYLDISNCCTDCLSAPHAITNGDDGVQGDTGLDGLLCLAPSLIHLLMADLSVEDIQGNLKYLLKLKQVRYLDISNCREKLPLNIYKNASVVLAKIVFHLSSLKSLDISGTNLGGPMIFKEADEIDYIQKRLYEDFPIDERSGVKSVMTIKSSVSGLMFLSNAAKKLDFFGCFCCDNSVSSRPNLPAVRIAGEESEKHLYTSLETYMQERPLFLLDALNHLFELYKDESIEDKLLGGHLIMNTMEQHLDNSRIQISGSASLFYVIKHSKEENIQLPHFYLRRLIKTVINGMEEHIDESAMRRNCVLIMCRLNLPDDVLFVSDRLIKILLKIFDDYIEDRNKVTTNDNDRPENFVLRTAMHLLNILACSVHGNDKFAVGSQAIPVAMDLIRTKTRFNDPDDILEVTWSFLWNITDETPENCKIFLDYCDGMNAFMDCIKFKKPEITRNMMGLLGNVAEVKHLRNRLCKNDFIHTFRDLLFQNTDGIEIPYNSAGVLVHIMSDGESAWNLAAADGCSLHDRANVITDIETAIDKWNLESERNINYRSFEPIFRLVNEYENPICQRWACWALANLTTVYPDIYCPLFERENGREILNKLLESEQVDSTIKKFAGIVLKNVDNNLKK